MVERVPERGRSRFIDKHALQRVVAETNVRMGIQVDPEATAEQAQQMMLADGLHAEENAFSRDIIRSRYPDQEE